MEALISLAELTPAQVAYAVAVVLIAGIVRGFAGFGMSAILVLALSFTLPPVQVVPMVMLMEVAASQRMLHGVWREVNWKLAAWLLVGSAMGTPLGAYLLASVPAPAMRIALSLFVLVMVVLLWRGFRLPGHPRPAWGLAAGLFSGTANGAASFGGQPNAVFLLSTSADAATVRATLVVIALFTDLYGSTVFALKGLLTFETLMRAAVFLLPMAVGILIGERKFRAAQQQTYRRAALLLLTALALTGLARVLFA